MTAENNERISIYFSRHLRTSLEAETFVRVPFNEFFETDVIFSYTFHKFRELEGPDYDSHIEVSNWCVVNISLDIFSMGLFG